MGLVVARKASGTVPTTVSIGVCGALHQQRRLGQGYFDRTAPREQEAVVGRTAAR
jgi:hypothetical protein